MLLSKKRKKIRISTNKRELSRREKREAERIRKMPDRSVPLLVIYILGILSMMYAFVESEMLTLSLFAGMAAVFTIVTVSIWYVYFYRYSGFLVLTAFVWLITAISVAWQIPELMHTYQSLFFDSAQLEVSPVVLIVLMIAAVYVLFAIEFVLRRHQIIFLVGAGIVILGPVGGMKIGPVTGVLIFTFLIAFTVLNMTDRRPGRSLKIKGRARVASRTTVLVSLAMVALFIPALIVQSLNAEKMYATVLQADSDVRDQIDMFTGEYMSNVLNGMVSRGNLRQTGETMFLMQAASVPEDNLYIKGYTGKDYYDDINYWESALTPDFPADYDLVNDPEPLTLVHYDDDSDRYIISEKGEKIFAFEHPGETIKEEHGYDVFIDSEGEFYLVDEDGDNNYLWDVVETYSPYKNIDLDPHRDQKSIDQNFLYHEIFVEELSRQSVHEYQKAARAFLSSCLMVDEKTKWVVHQNNLDELTMYADDEENDNPFAYYGPVYAIQTDDGKIRFNLLNAEPLLLSSGGVTEYKDSKSKKNEPAEAWMDFDPEEQPEIKKLMNYPELILNDRSSDPVSDIYSHLGLIPEAKMNSSGWCFNDIRIYPKSYYSMQNLIPYYAEYTTTNVPTSDDNSASSQDDDFQETTDDNASDYYYANTYYEQGVINMHDQWKNYPVYEKFIDDYQDRIQSEYTNYPRGTMPRLEELCHSTRYLQNVNEVTTFIAYTLQNNATYSTTPGGVPWTKNTVEYFLFDNHKGYCVHYATTAAMMYRMFGIPARYVTGYVVSPASFENNEEGAVKNGELMYKAEVTDYSAHAWVEIFLKDHGWVPVEFTPDMFNEMHTSYPGYGYQEMQDIMDKYGWKFRAFSTSAAEENGGFAGGAGKAVIRIMNRIVYFIPAITAAVILIIIAIRRRLILRRIHRLGCRRLFDLILRALHFSGYIKGMYGCEEDFAARLADVPCIAKEDALRITQIMLADAFSEVPAGEEENKYLLSQYRSICSGLYKELIWYKKPVFKFLLGHI